MGQLVLEQFIHLACRLHFARLFSWNALVASATPCAAPCSHTGSACVLVCVECSRLLAFLVVCFCWIAVRGASSHSIACLAGLSLKSFVFRNFIKYPYILLNYGSEEQSFVVLVVSGWSLVIMRCWPLAWRSPRSWASCN